jgi:hypothetical protein
VPRSLVVDLDTAAERHVPSFSDGGPGDVPPPMVVSVDDPAAAPTDLLSEAATLGRS